MPDDRLQQPVFPQEAVTSTPCAHLTVCSSVSLDGVQFGLELDAGQAEPGRVFAHDVVIERPSGERIVRRFAVLEPMLLGSVLKVVLALQQEQALREQQGRRGISIAEDALDCLRRQGVRVPYVTPEGLQAISEALAATLDDGGMDICRIECVAPHRVAEAEAIWRSALPMLIAARLDAQSLARWGLLPTQAQQLAPLLLQPGDRMIVPEYAQPIHLRISLLQQGQSLNATAPATLMVGCDSVVSIATEVAPEGEMQDPPKRVPPTAPPETPETEVAPDIEIDAPAEPESAMSAGDPLIFETLLIEASKSTSENSDALTDLRAQLSAAGVDVPDDKVPELQRLAGYQPLPAWLAAGVQLSPSTLTALPDRLTLLAPNLWFDPNLPPAMARRVAAAALGALAAHTEQATEATINALAGLEPGHGPYDTLSQVTDTLLQSPPAAAMLAGALAAGLADCGDHLFVPGEGSDASLVSVLLVSGVLSATGPSFLSALTRGDAQAALRLARADIQVPAPRLVE